MKSTIQRLLHRSGYELRKINKKPTPTSDAFEVAFSTLMSTKDRVSIVQVGANDGVLNDPLYPMIKRVAQRTQIMLIEPQNALIPFLSQNYAFHPAATIHNGAVGTLGVLELHTVKAEAWSSLEVPYAKGWPPYRAPSGVTSSNRDHVRRWLVKYYKGEKRADDIIEILSVRCSPLIPLLREHGWSTTIDVLQVDAEGHDDKVIYECAIAETKPRLINFEWINLAEAAKTQLRQHLEGFGYTLYAHGGNMLAVASSFCVDATLQAMLGSPGRAPKAF